MAKKQFRVDLVDHAVKMVLSVLQSVTDAGAGMDEVLLIQAKVNSIIDYNVLMEKMAVMVLAPDKPDGDKH